MDLRNSMMKSGVGMGAPGLFSVVLVGGVEGRGYGKVGRTEGLGVETGRGNRGLEHVGKCGMCGTYRSVWNASERVEMCGTYRHVLERVETCPKIPEVPKDTSIRCDGLLRHGHRNGLMLQGRRISVLTRRGTLGKPSLDLVDLLRDAG